MPDRKQTPAEIEAERRAFEFYAGLEDVMAAEREADEAERRACDAGPALLAAAKLAFPLMPLPLDDRDPSEHAQAWRAMRDAITRAEGKR